MACHQARGVVLLNICFSAQPFVPSPSASRRSLSADVTVVVSPGAAQSPVHAFIMQLPSEGVGGVWDSDRNQFMDGLNPSLALSSIKRNQSSHRDNNSDYAGTTPPAPYPRKPSCPFCFPVTRPEEVSSHFCSADNRTAVPKVPPVTCSGTEQLRPGSWISRFLSERFLPFDRESKREKGKDARGAAPQIQSVSRSSLFRMNSPL